MPATGVKVPAPAGGAVDLSAWDFTINSTVPLVGEWRYFDRRWSHDVDGAKDAGLPAVMPGPWPVREGTTSMPRQNGFGTYVLTVRLPPAPDGERFAIDTGYIYSAYRLYANGELIGENGTPAATGDQETPRVYSVLARLPDNTRELELRLELSNHFAMYGGAFVAPILGLERPLTEQRALITALSLFMLGTMLFAAVYHIFVYLLTRNGPAMVWFGACAGFLGIRTLLIEPLANYVVPFIGQDWLWRTNFTLSILALPPAYLFFMLSFPRQFSRKLSAPISGFCLSAAAMTLVFGPVIGVDALRVFEALAVATFAYIMWGVVRAALERETGSYLALVGWAISATATVHDIMMDNGLATGINLIPFGFIAFFLCLSGTIAAQFNKSLRDVETLSAKLQRANATLEDAVRERTAQLSHKLVELETARAEAVSASVAKSNFLATMSHEIRTPLNAVLGLAGLLSETRLEAEQRHHVQLIKESGDHLLTVINDILDLSKLDAGQVELEAAPFDPAALTKGAVELLSARARERGLSLTVNISSPRPEAVMGDAARVRQILINLIGNAIKFTPQGAVRVSLSAYADGAGGTHHLQWGVSDTGIGIPRDRLPLLFQNFAQADNSISRRFGGTGLGLAICKRLCDRMGGTIDVTTEEGKSTTFHVDLHLPEGKLETVTRPAAVAGRAEIRALAAKLGRPLRVLVAEDNVTNQVVTRGILKSCAIDADLANNGIEAVEAVKRYPYDVVLMDVQMPEMDGLAATRRIRAMGGTYAVLPIVALSANAFTRDAEDCRAAGMNGHVAKPVRKDLLLAAIHEALTTGARFVTDEAADDQAPDFDRGAIDHLIDSLTESATKELLGEFVGAARAKIEQLPRLLAKAEALTIEVHAIKSSARQVGAVALSRLAAELERKATAREPILEEEFAALSGHLAAYARHLAALNLIAA